MSFGGRPEESNGMRDDLGRDVYRRRSPGPPRRARENRQRSRSPQHIDRYQPSRSREGEDGFDRRNQYRRRSPPPTQGNIDRYMPGQNEPQAPVVNTMPNPLTLNDQVGFTYFAEWWRKEQEVKADREALKHGGRRPAERIKGEKEAKEEREKEREKIQSAYDEYKIKFQGQVSRTFVQQHKDQEWFKERYDPEVRDPIRQRQAAHRRENFNVWLNDLENGVFDEFTLEGIYKGDSDGAGGLVEKEEGETAAAAEVLGVSDLLPTKGGDLRDEVLSQPTVLIKTIAPYISREQLENLCSEHLGDGEGGFKWLSLSEPQPLKKWHRYGWVLLNPGGEQTVEVPKEDGTAGDEEVAEEGEDTMETTHPETVTKSGVEMAAQKLDGQSITDPDKGTFQCHVGPHTSSSMPRRKALWDLFSVPERIEKDLELAQRLVTKFETELGEDINGVDMIDRKVEQLRDRGDLQPEANGTYKPPKLESEDVEEGEEGEEGAMDEDGVLADDEVDDENMLVQKKKLDLLVEYLRRVHNFCFFCVFETDSVHALTQKCPGGHLRRPRSSLTTSAKSVAKASAYGEAFPLKRENTKTEEGEEGSPVNEKRFDKKNKTHLQLQRAFTWVKTYEEKLFQILEPDSVDITKLGGRPLEEGVEEELRKFVKKEDENKCRCKVPECTKLFKGENFWRKHVKQRHEDFYNSIHKNLYLINAYVLDPAHVTPPRSENSNSAHFSTNGNVQASQQQRGFNYQGMQMQFPHPMAMGLPQGAGFPPSFGNYPVSMPNMAAYGANAFMMQPNGHGGGPMRRGRGGFNRNAGPYDRQNQRGRGYGNAGRLTPPRGGSRAKQMVSGQHFVEGDAATTGPREAIAGRTMKSYEDLDAVQGDGSGALDY